jgi:hypothetical protein
LTKKGTNRRRTLALAVALTVPTLLLGGSRIAAGTTTATTYRADVLAAGPTSYWRLGETSGTTAADEVGANTGNYTNVTLNQPGALVSEINPSASFDGTSSYVLVPESSSLDMSSAVTVEFWAKRRTVSGTYQVVVGKPGNGQTKLENYAVWLNTSNVYQAYFGNGTTYVSVTTPAVTDTNWHYIVATDDGSSAKIYLDGVLRGSASTTLKLTPNLNPLNIGRANNGAYFFNGWIDEVAIYPTALSSGTIQAHYTKGMTDLVPPVVTLTTPANGSSSASSNVTFSGTAGNAAGDASTVSVNVYSGTNTTGTPAQTLNASRQPDNSYSVSGSIADGTWTAQATQSDSAGNVGSSSANTFTVAAAAPLTTITGPSDPTNQTSATLYFSADKPATFTCALDGAAFASCTSPQAYSGLSDARHTFQVKATGQSGLTSTTSYSWTVDTAAPPSPTIDSTPPSETESTSATFGLSDTEAGVTLLCQLDASGFSACTSPQTYTDLAVGVHTFTAKARDAAGNTSGVATYTWTVTAASVPPPTFSSTPSNPSSAATATFSFSDTMSNVTFECSVDGAAYAACTSPTDVPGLADGSHTFQVRARDAANDVSDPATYTWTVDTTAPSETLTSKPADPSNTSSASFSFSAGETVTFQCTLDGAAPASCTSPQTYSSLADGSHTFHLSATDDAGNTSTTTYAWTVDTMPPTTTITSTPPNPSNSPSASVSFTADETATFQCSLDGDAFVSCTSTQTYSGLTDGDHTFRAKATDLAGNTGQATGFSWSIDTVPPPAPTITSKPSSLTTSTNASFGFSDTERGVLLLCQLDASAFTTCTSPKTYAGLGDGNHTFQVEAADAAGNTSAAASYTWTVDTTPPVTTLSSTPPSLSNQRTASFGFFANEQSTFQCKRDTGAFVACTSPTVYTGLADGSHTFQVKATDQAGNIAQTVSYSWAIDATAPTVTLISPANGDTRAEWPTVTGAGGTASGDTATVTVSIYSGSSATGTPLQTLAPTVGQNGTYAVTVTAPLNPGTYTAQTEQTDTAGNVGSSAANTFTVGDPQILAAGDIAYCATDGASRTGPLLANAPDAMVVPLGDIAYVNGQPDEYQNCYDPTWGYAKARTRPVVGAHDEGTVPGGPPAGTGYVNYFANQLAPMGPTASDLTKLYYSYDLGAWHIVALNDSCLEGVTPNCDEAAQEQWLKDDLSAHMNQCTLVASHEPRWSSDSIHGNRPQFGTFWNIFYQYGVDLVLNGSAHDYERFAPQDPLGKLDSSYGIREIVAGTGGDFTYDVGTRQPTSQVYASDSYGVLKVTLHANSYDWQFIPVADGKDPDGGSSTDSGTTSCHGAPPPQLLGPQVQASSSNSAASAASLSINEPSATAAGDLLVAIVSHQGGSTRSVSPPAGWTAVPRTDFSNGSNARIHAYYHFAGSSEPASYVFALTGGTSQAMAGGIFDITGANATTPINASNGQSNGTTASKSVPAPSITTTVVHTLLIYGGAVNSNANWTAPGLMSEGWQQSTNGPYKISTESAGQPIANAGATGTRTGFLSTSGTSVAIMIAIAGLD